MFGSQLLCAFLCNSINYLLFLIDTELRGGLLQFLALVTDGEEEFRHKVQ